MSRPRPAFLLSTSLLVAALGLSMAALPAAAADEVVTVKAGDTLSEIALEHGVTVQQLLRLNGLTDARRIYPGQRLTLRGTTPHSTQVSPRASVVHRVAAGENLTVIAEHYRVTVAAIVAANKISNPSYLRVGQQLTIPAPGATPHSATTGSPQASVVHRVAAGENLTVIAEHYRVTVAAIVAANKISNPSYLRVGQQLTIPATGATRDASEPSFSTSMPSSLRALVAQRDDIRRLLSAEARAQGVPVAFVYAIAWQESGWQQRVVSSFGAIGVMQLTPATTDWIGGSLLGQRFDPRDAAQNIRAGVALLRHYLDRYHGDRSLVLAAYYQGQRAADLHGVYAVTRPYIESIKALVALFGG